MRSIRRALFGLLVASFSVSIVIAAESGRDNDEKVADLESEISTRVIGGDPAEEGMWPWQVALYALNASGEYSSICGGSVIEKNWVLTAAHCVYDKRTRKAKDASAFKIVEATNRIDRRLLKGGKGRVIAVERVVAHDSYDDARIQNDIALLKLGSSAVSKPISLAYPEMSPLELPGRAAIVTGWGAVRPYDPDTWTDPKTNEKLRPWDPRYFRDRLQQADLPIIDCKEAPQKWQSSIDRRNLCASVPGGVRSSCQGDSGGPLVAKRDDGSFAQIGVVSFGGSPCNNGPSVFSRVSAFKEWMEASSGLKLFDQPPPSPPPGPKPPPAPKPPAPDVSRDNPSGVAVSFVEGQTLKIGQRAHFRVTTRNPGYLVLLDVTPDRKLTQIFPNSRSLSTPTGSKVKANYLDAARPLLVPDKSKDYEGFEYTIEEPIGEGRIVAILSSKPLKSVVTSELPKSMQGMEAADFLSELTGELRQDLELKQDAKAWSFAVKKYEIIR